jgi:hypothetical protein
MRVTPLTAVAALAMSQSAIPTITYRAILPGPNVGTTYAPDSSSVVDALGDLDPKRRPR